MQGSAVVIRGTAHPFDAAAFDIRTTRPDIFSEGYYSLFDMLLAVAASKGIVLAWHWDAACGTHFIDSVDGAAGSFWYRFSYDAGSGTQAELGNRREIRWDELLYQPGAWVQLVTGENLDELKNEYREETARERRQARRPPFCRSPSTRAISAAIRPGRDASPCSGISATSPSERTASARRAGTRSTACRSRRAS
ncbi:MAG: hypothetical protein IPP94_17810 [Ignavibacteria bacterium]|nr:hypothetical protein [Ignavibacteria bacterium]